MNQPFMGIDLDDFGDDQRFKYGINQKFQDTIFSDLLIFTGKPHGY
jgi:hypothetical protein